MASTSLYEEMKEFNNMVNVELNNVMNIIADNFYKNREDSYIAKAVNNSRKYIYSVLSMLMDDYVDPNGLDLMKEYISAMNKTWSEKTNIILSKHRTDIKIHLHSKNIITSLDHEQIKKWVENYIIEFYKLYPHFMLHEIYINIDENNNIINDNFINKNININISEINNNYNNVDDRIISRTHIENLTISYLPEIIQCSLLELTDYEKIYLSKENICKLNLKDNFNMLRGMPIEIGQSKISFIGEDYRQATINFYSTANFYQAAFLYN